ncbi:FAD-binding protein, partial [Synechococcus sp. EJ6-Ellesmere]|uniref:FAD-binding protein n=1 Tax=Synechococcus sp. EJ6-Ellesmere TaxID=2823734 RepID=UPI0020CC0B13
EAAHSHRRVLHAQDRTRGALVDALESEVLRRPGLVQLKGLMALQIWVEQGRCLGLQVLENDQVRWLGARAVVLASGGGGHLFEKTTNPSQSTGDGVAMAWRAGATIRDLEFVQFHPTALMLPGAPHFLISEAVRGEGARLIDSHGHSPVTDLASGDLAPRDQVSRALVRTMQAQGVDHLWLDLRPVGQERLNRQFPTILRRCRELGLEPTAAPIPVAPAAHYWMGGVSTDLSAATNLPGLYAVGEVACSGVHGANRLASNSLMECLVFAGQLRQLSLPEQQPLPRTWGSASPAAGSGCPPQLAQALPLESELLAQSERLRRLCWRVAGVERQERELREALGLIRLQRLELDDHPWIQALARLEPGDQLALGPGGGGMLRPLNDLRQLLTLADLLVEAALFRRESRGGHYRTDCPAPQPFWQRHSRQQRGEAIHTTPLLEGNSC